MISKDDPQNTRWQFIFLALFPLQVVQTLLLERQLRKIFNDSISRYSHSQKKLLRRWLPESVPSESEAICLTADLGRLLEREGFNLTKGILNSCKLIK